MIICESKHKLTHFLQSLRLKGKTIGFVPTMGALHSGHISLIETAKKNCDVVVCSIFVNPTQFNDINDLKNYPKTFDADKLLLQSANCDVLFAPELDDMYTLDELKTKENNSHDTSWMDDKKVDFGLLDKVMEGAHRPGHFNGVAQVVSKLFRIVEPQKAFFGQKDFQQLAIIKSMTKQLEMNIEIVSCPIMREKDGLAMSSRNVRLKPNERSIANLICKILMSVKEKHETFTVDELKTFVNDEIKKEPKMVLDYFEIANSETLQPLDNFDSSNFAVACIAVKLGDVRLIDNVVLG